MWEELAKKRNRGLGRKRGGKSVGEKKGEREEGRVGPAREGNGGKERRNWMK